VVVYDRDEWWKDTWDASDYGREFDFSQPFFDQFSELQKVVPHFSLHNIKAANSDFVNYSRNNKNCYLCFSTSQNEDCYYCANIDHSRDCLDCFGVKEQSEMCFEAIDVDHCFSCYYAQNCSSSSDCWFCYDCVGCQECFGCVGLRNASYYWYNQPLGKDEYQKKFNELDRGSFFAIEELKVDFEKLKQKFPRKYTHALNAVDCTGDYLTRTKNLKNSFEVHDSEDCSYVTRAFGLKDCQDLYGSSDSELLYNSLGVGVSSNVIASMMSYYNRDISYCSLCYDSHDLFGCIALRAKKFCILNKQYNEMEYKILRDKIITHMGKTGEWGEFFSSSMSPFGYNETIAEDIFPRSQEEAVEQGFNWRDNLPFTIGLETMRIEDLPNNINDVGDNICREILACSICRKNFKIIPQELDFHQKHSLPLPRLCSDCRHQKQLSYRNQRQLYDRQCAKCGKAIQTTYAPERPERIYCEECYQKEIY